MFLFVESNTLNFELFRKVHLEPLSFFYIICKTGLSLKLDTITLKIISTPYTDLTFNLQKTADVFKS